MSDWRSLKSFCVGLPQYGLNVSAHDYMDTGTRFFRTSDINDRGEVTDIQPVYVQESIIGPEYRLVEGDLLLSRSGTLGRCLRYQRSLGGATFAGYLIRFRPSHASEPRYLEYCTQARFFQQAIDAQAPSSTISNFNAERYANLSLPWWPLDRQRAIADYLDVETGRIDALITKKRRMIELLQQRWRSMVEYRMQSLMNVYGAIALKRLIACLDGRRVPLSAEERSSRSGPYPYYGASGVIDSVDSYLFDETLVLLGEDGAQLADPDYEISFVVRGKVWVNNHAHVLRPVSVEPCFLAMHLTTLDRGAFISGATREKITQTDMNEIPVPNVSMSVQSDVARELSSERSRCERAISAISRQVDLLAERRQCLITTAVLGELTVPVVAV